MLKDRWQASKFFISADLGASCLGWLAGFFAFAVALGFVEQHKIVELPDVLRRYIFQLFLIGALWFLYRQGWRTNRDLGKRVWMISFGWMLLYSLGLVIIDSGAKYYGFQSTAGVPEFLFNDQIFLSAVVAPIVEELFFRDLLFRTFVSRWPNLWVGILASSFFFMIAHQSFYIGALLLGSVNAILFIYSGSVVPGILFHTMSNLSWYFFPKLFPYAFDALKAGGWLNLFYRS